MKKVLVVDDDVWLAESYRRTLEDAGWQVAVAARASQAIDLIDEMQPGVVLLDIMLPESSAPALLNELQSHSDLAKLPIVLCSSLALDAGSQAYLASYGVKQVIDKTKITPEAIVKSLENALNADG